MSAGWSLAVTVVLLAINAFFVAGEFAVTSTRRSQIEPLADAGERRAGDALYALRHVSLMLAICQLGVTVASTTLGVVAEPAIAHLVESPLARLGAPEASSHVVGFALALVIVLFCHVVFGEMVPKNISIAAPVRMLLLLAPVLVRLGRVLRPIIAAMDRFANWFVRLHVHGAGGRLDCRGIPGRRQDHRRARSAQRRAGVLRGDGRVGHGAPE